MLHINANYTSYRAVKIKIIIIIIILVVMTADLNTNEKISCSLTASLID